MRPFGRYKYVGLVGLGMPYDERLQSFADRMVQTNIAPGFFEAHTDLVSDEKRREAVEYAARRLERSYNVVAQVERDGGMLGDEDGFIVRAIATHDAHIDDIQNGFQGVHYWIDHYEENDEN